MLVHWPDVTEAGAICNQPLIIEDFLPTILEMAETSIPKNIDGRSFADLLHGRVEPSRKNRAFVWHFPNNWGPKGPGIGPSSSIRLGDWKFIHYYEDRPAELFNIAQDIGEQNNLADQQPHLRRQLASRLQQYLTAKHAQFPTDRRSGQKLKVE